MYGKRVVDMLKGVTYGRRQEDEAGVGSAGEDRE